MRPSRNETNTETINWINNKHQFFTILIFHYLRLCGKSHSDAIISVYGTLFIRFRSDSAGSGRGFLLEFETEDFDECVTNNGGCSHFCHNTIGSFYCSCPQSMTLSKRGDYCIGKWAARCELSPLSCLSLIWPRLTDCASMLSALLKFLW